MKLTVSRSKNATLYYVQKSYRTDSGKSSTRTVERLGTLEEVKVRFGEENTIEAMKEYIKALTKADKEQNRNVVIKLSQNKLIKKGEQRSYNVGYLFLQKVYYELGIYKYLAKKINVGMSHFTPDEILSTLQQMNMMSVAGEGYVPAYTRTDVTNNLHGSAGFRTDTQIVIKQEIKK